MKDHLRPVLAGLTLAACCAGASGEISLKNGNYFTGSKDITYPGGFQPTIERVYNSKTSYKGIFGNGWGNEYEIYLQVGGDGSVTVHEYGGGADNRFNRPTMTTEDITKAIEKIVAVAQAQGDITGDQNVAAYRMRLSNDVSFRNNEWSSYVQKSLLQPATIPVGTKLVSDHFSYQVITVMRDGYRRDFDNGRVEFYRTNGKLRQISDKNGNYITFSYDVPRQIAIRDNFGRTITLKENERGLVTHIEGSNQRTCEYSYNESDELIYARDADGEVYQYEYDGGHRHNLVKTTFSDKTTEEIEYYPRELYENVKSDKSREGSLSMYSYDIDKSDKRHYTVSVRQFDSPDKSGKRPLQSTSTYEYINLTKLDGEEYTSRMITTIDGSKTDTTYNLDGLPTRIEHDGEVVTFVYDDKGHVIRKVTPALTTELSYDPVVNKVNFVRHTDPKTSKVLDESHYGYDAKGNLVTASSNENSIRLQYDAKGRISEIETDHGGNITFAYDNNSKPVKITVLEHKDESDKIVPEGSITVTYNGAGEMQKVDSPTGRTTAIAVTTAFQNLLDIIRPAGVSLSF